MDLTTPALLFPAISLLLLAYTSRFLTLAQIIRSLKERQLEEHSIALVKPLTGQIQNLRKRLLLIKNMQVLGVLSFILCTFSMFFLFVAFTTAGIWTFGLSLLLLAASLLLSLYEVAISTDALNIHLDEVGEKA